jgi:hypothetical protein
MTPWTLEGTATVDVWYLPTIHFDVGPVTWGSASEEPPPAVSPLAIVAAALAPDAAWMPCLPDGAEMLVRFAPGELPALFVHPLGAVEAKQIQVPLETTIDRIGKSPVIAHRVNLASPLIGAAPAGAVSEVDDLFAPGQFLDLTDDERLSRPSFEQFPAGARFAATAGPLFGTPVDAVYEWHTIFPHESLAPRRDGQRFATAAAAVLRAGAVARASRARGNAYTVPPSPITLAPAGDREIRRSDDLGSVAGLTTRMTTTAATRALAGIVASGAEAGRVELVVAGVDR